MDFKPTVAQRHARPTKVHSAESRHWRSFKHPVFVKEYQPVTSIHFSPTSPHRYAVTSATHIQIYAPRTQKVVKNISRFKDTARSGHIRSDGKLVVAGDDSGLIQLFDINSRAILRTLKEHKLAVHVTKFSPGVSTELLSCSDDTTVKLWDIPSESSKVTFTGHKDFVRSGHILPSNPSLILTGSYDSTMRLWDARTGQSEMMMNCATARTAGGVAQIQPPVWDVLPFPSGTLALSSSGDEGMIRLWDLVAGGRCIHAMSNHKRAVSALVFNGDHSRVLTGGLDQMVKVYDVTSWKVVHTMRYPAPILCLALSPDDTHIAAGMADGTFSVRRRQPKASELADVHSGKGRATAFQSFLEGGGEFPEALVAKGKNKAKAAHVGDADELRIESRRQKQLKPYDRYLKAFRYSSALDEVVKKTILPSAAFAVITELIHQDALRIALGGRDDVLLEPIIQFLLKHVTDYRFGELACDMASLVLDMYGPVFGQSPLIDPLLGRLKKAVDAELHFQKELRSLQGALDMIMATSALSAS